MSAWFSGGQYRPSWVPGLEKNRRAYSRRLLRYHRGRRSGEIFLLGGDIGFARFNGAKLVVADPAIGHFLLSFGNVEAPASVGLDERQRQGPAALPDAQ